MNDTPRRKFYAEIDHKRLLQHIPGMIEAFPDRYSFDAEKAKEVIDKFIAEKYAQIDLDDLMSRLEGIKEGPTADKIRAIIDDNEVTFELSNIILFSSLLSEYADSKVDKKAIEEFSIYSHIQLQPFIEIGNEVVTTLSSLSDEQKLSLLNDESLVDHKVILAKLFNDKRQTVDNPEEIAAEIQSANSASHQHMLDIENSDYKAKASSFAKYLNAKAKEKSATVKMQGYADSFEASYAINGTGIDDLDAITQGMKSSNIEEINDKNHIVFLQQINEPRFTFEEAVDIARNTIAKLDPRLADRVDSIFSEHRAHIENSIGFSATTFTDLYNIENKENDKPIFFAKFNGSLLAVHTMVHEITHVIHGELAIENNHALCVKSPAMQQEHFSHFVELLLEDELNDRDTEHQNQELYDYYFQYLIANNAALNQHGASFLREVFRNIEAGEEISAETVDSLYKTSGKEVYGSSWQGKESCLEDQLFMSNVIEALKYLPHQMNAYFPNHVAACALKEKFDENPEKIGAQVVKAMKAGGTISYEDLMDSYFGKGEYAKGTMFKRGMEIMAERSNTICSIADKIEEEYQTRMATMRAASVLDASGEIGKIDVDGATKIDLGLSRET